MALARRAKGEIVACDSVQVYRGFDIGSAKTSAQDQADIRHHLLDVVEPHASFDAQLYCNLAEAAFADCRARGHMPIVCGGTGLYVRALRYGLAPTITAQPAFRAERMAEEAKRPGRLFAALQACDPVSAAAIGPQNLVQILRALEISVMAQEPASAIRARHKAARQARPMHLIQPVWPDAVLRARIETRIDAMLGQGLIDEVEGLLASGVDPSCRPMGAVGYREVRQYLSGDIAKSNLKAAIAKSSWAYARRQRTWLRREAGVQMLPMQGDAQDVDRAWALVHHAP